MEKVAFAMKEGEWAEVEDTPNRVVLIQFVEQKHRELDEVSSLIEQRLQTEDAISFGRDERERRNLDGQALWDCSCKTNV